MIKKLMLLPFFIALGCSQNQNLSPSIDPVKPHSIFNQAFRRLVVPINLSIVDINGKPIPNVQVMIGSSLNLPFRNNYLRAGQNGLLRIPLNWTDEQPVTLDAPGFIRATFLNQEPKAHTYILRAKEDPTSFVLSGRTDGFSVKNYDGQVDFGVVIPGITKQNFFNFNLLSFVSPFNDQINVIGQRLDVPANLTLPAQSEQYFISFKLDKPNYRLQVKKGATQVFMSTRGQFPLNEMISAVNSGQDLTELPNLFKFGGGSIKEISITGNTSANFNVAELNFNKKLSIRGPQIAADEFVLAAALSPYKNSFVPTDLKSLKTGAATSLNVTSATGLQMLAVLKKKNEVKEGQNIDRMSMAFVPLTANSSPQFIALLNKPSLTDAFHFKVDLARKPNGLTEGAQYAILSKLTKTQIGGVEISTLDNKWDVYSPKWQSQISIPEWPNESAPTGALRWEVMLTAVPDPSSITNLDLGLKWLEAASHATRTSVDF